jgi:hypothetical protein
MKILFYFLIGFLLAFAITSNWDNSTTTKTTSIPELKNPGFKDITSQSGIDYIQHAIYYQIDDQSYLRGELQGLFSGGADAADYDNDGDLDLFVTRLDNTNILYENQEGKFIDISEKVKLNKKTNGNKAKWLDVNNDGWQDLFISTIGDNKDYLFMNYNGEFIEQGSKKGLGESPHLLYGFGIATGDYNNDGYIDIMTSNWDRTTIRDSSKDVHGIMLQNVRGKFNQVESKLSTRMITEQGFGDVSFDSEFADINNDGLLDLLVAADFGNSRLYQNTGEGFADRTDESNFGLDEFGMGITTGDYNNDGLIDVFVTSIYCQEEDCMEGMSGNKFYRNNGNGFDEISEQLGVEDGGWGWETEFFDYDLDGDLDLIMVMGMKEKIMGDHDFTSNALKLWRNDQTVFTDVTEELGLTISGEGRDVIIFDYDNDGDEDIFVVRNGENGVLFENLIL